MQGLGLFAARDIEKQTMVIEYLGNILRNEVAMRKELHYKAMVWILFWKYYRVHVSGWRLLTVTAEMNIEADYSCYDSFCGKSRCTHERIKSIVWRSSVKKLCNHWISLTLHCWLFSNSSRTHLVFCSLCIAELVQFTVDASTQVWLCCWFGFVPQNRAVFMFRIDSDCVIDATCSGSPAR